MKLVTNGLVTGNSLDSTDQEIQFCNSCTYAKATRKPVPKVCDESNCAKVFGEEIHSDVWGPAPVVTLGNQ